MNIQWNVYLRDKNTCLDQTKASRSSTPLGGGQAGREDNHLLSRTGAELVKCVVGPERPWLNTNEDLVEGPFDQ